jgi:putative ABC transport system permease protein
MKLTNEHIDYISKDLHYRGIVHEGLQEELVDHISSAVEQELEKGSRFIDAYHTVLKRFGHTPGLRQTQQQTLFFENPKSITMLRNYFVIALRNLRKHSFYTFINVAGLSIGIAICLVILLFVNNELRYDRHHVNAERIYRIKSEIKFGGNHYNMIYTPAPVAAALVAEIPEVEASVQFRQRGSYLVKRETENIKEQDVIWASNDFFKIFSVPLLAGNAYKALNEPNTIAISKRVADKFFADEEALGQTLILDNQMNTKVTAVYEDMPANSHFHFDMIISMEGLPEAKSDNWLSNNFQTYMLLREGTDPKVVNQKILGLLEKHLLPQASQVFGADFTMEKFIESGNKVEYTLQPMVDIHLGSNLQGEFEPNFDKTYVYLFVAIALFILIIACINFMNLSTARSANRAKEVGVRKVMGSYRSHLMRQFLTESIMLSVLSFVLALGMAYLLLPLFNQLSGRELVIPFTQPLFYALFLASALLVGVLAGVYPSFFLSAFKPVNVLKGNVSLGMKSGFIRSSLVVFQFMISIFLVIGTLVVYLQLSFIQNKKIGFNKDQVITVNDAYALGANRVTYKDEIMKNSMMLNATITGFLPVRVADSWRSDTPWWPEGKEATQENMISLQNWRVDHDYIKTMGMTMKEGRDFSRDFPSDSSAVILNEEAAKAFALGDKTIGSRIVSFGGDEKGGPDTKNLQSLTIIGIVENFHFESLREEIGPAMLLLSKRPEGAISFRFQSSDVKEVVALLEQQWKVMAPGQPFNYSFLDESFGSMYAAETRLSKIFSIFSTVAIVIACLGLFALTAFTAEQRTKEIGIRKVLGASVTSIVMMLSKDFGKLVLIAFVITVPLAWWGVDKWLEQYQYKVQIGWPVYVLAGIIAFLIAWVTMSYQSIKAATSDPVKSLRSE